MNMTIGEVSIPVDDSGFILLQCPFCSEFFKIHPKDYEADDVIEIHCPSCGFKANSYLTEEVLELARKKAINYANSLIYKETKKLERQLKGANFSFKASKQVRRMDEYPIRYGIDNLEVIKYLCCNREAKVKPIYKMCGSYCPFCGVRYEKN